ncbi:MAG: DUF6946 family protein [Candidatus Binataceae bacterium]
MERKREKFFVPTRGTEDWKKLLADPCKQWRSGYSAKTLAECWQNCGDFPPSVLQALAKADSSAFEGVELLAAFPEWQVPLPPKSGHPSQNDIFALARSKRGPITICVEGKIKEPFGELVKDWFEPAAGGIPSDGKKERLTFLLEKLGLTRNQVDNIRYQLLHRTASALTEAERFGAKIALMLVHSFSPTHEWFKDFSDFAALYGITPEVGQVKKAARHKEIDLHLGWVSDPLK